MSAGLDSIMVIRQLVAVLVLFLFLTACTENGGPAATSTSPSVGGQTPAPTAPRPAATQQTGTTPAPTATASQAPVDGTVDPLGFGGTDPVTIKSNPDPISEQAVLRDVRVGAHPEQGGWDRIVFEFANVRPEGDIRYVQQATQCGSGFNVPLSGSAVLLVRFTATRAHTDAGQSTIPSRDISGPGGVILQSRQICDFEAHVDWAIGVRSQQRFKVTNLTNPMRVVIDIKRP